MTKNWSFFFLAFFFFKISPHSKYIGVMVLLRPDSNVSRRDLSKYGLKSAVLYAHWQFWAHKWRKKCIILVYYDTSWCLMVTIYCWILRCITMYYDVLRCITMHYDALRCITRHYEALRGHMRPYEAIWGHMRPYEATWKASYNCTIHDDFSVFLFFVFCSNKWKCTRNASLLRSNSTVSHQNTFKFDLRSDALRLYFHWFDKKKKKNKKKKKEKKSSWMVPHTVHHAVLMWPCMPS